MSGLRDAPTPPWIIIAVVIALAQVVTRSLAVSGAQPTDPGEDFQAYSVRYHNCLFKCDQDGCAYVAHRGEVFEDGGCVPSCARNGAALEGAHPPEFSLPMRLAGWDCASDCKFRCMQSTMALRAVEGLRPAKYYGKWSFHRVLGMQEIISSLASVANAAVHVRYLPELLRVSLDRVRPSPARNRARLWLVNAVVNVNGWTWSAVFHARDTPRTHFMDYASANAIFFFALFAVLVRVWGRRGGRLRWPLAAAFCLWFAAHVREMNAPADGLKYQYERNMRVMIGVAVAHWSLLLLWAFPRAWGRKSWEPHPGRRVLFGNFACWHVAAVAEVADFPPLGGVLDAHALWHCATVPCVWLWYAFVRSDLREGEGNGAGQTGKGKPVERRVGGLEKTAAEKRRARR